jgi:acyl-coenzyme A synthetase/AMP-(fatty) acid ligase
MIDDRFFYLLGRNSDLVKIGGKRESLSGLSYKLKKIDGVDDDYSINIVPIFSQTNTSF